MDLFAVEDGYIIDPLIQWASLTECSFWTRLKTPQLSLPLGLFFIKIMVEKDYRIDWSVIFVYINVVHS